MNFNVKLKLKTFGKQPNRISKLKEVSNEFINPQHTKFWPGIFAVFLKLIWKSSVCAAFLLLFFGIFTFVKSVRKQIFIYGIYLNRMHVWLSAFSLNTLFKPLMLHHTFHFTHFVGWLLTQSECSQNSISARFYVINETTCSS